MGIQRGWGTPGSNQGSTELGCNPRLSRENLGGGKGGAAVGPPPKTETPPPKAPMGIQRGWGTPGSIQGSTEFACSPRLSGENLGGGKGGAAVGPPPKDRDPPPPGTPMGIQRGLGTSVGSWWGWGTPSSSQGSTELGCSPRLSGENLGGGRGGSSCRTPP